MAAVNGLTLGMVPLPSGNPSFSNHTLDANNDGIAFGFQARGAEPITHILVRYGLRTGTPPAFIATLEGMTTGGAPDAADVGGGSPTAKIFTPPADTTWDGTQQAIELTNPFTPARGQFLIATIRYSSGTIDASNNSTFTNEVAGLVGNLGFPCSQRLTAGTWAKRQSFPCFGIRTATTRYGSPMEALYNTRSASTVGHRQAVKFTLPAGSGTTKKVKGIRFFGSPAGVSAAKAPVIGLWSAAGTIQTVTFDSDFSTGANSSYLAYDIYFDEVTLTALNFGTAYYAGMEVADAVNGGVLLNGLQLDSADDLDAYPGGSNFHLSTFDGTNWADDATVRPFAELILDDVSSAAGGIVTGLIGGGLAR